MYIEIFRLITVNFNDALLFIIVVQTYKVSYSSGNFSYVSLSRGNLYSYFFDLTTCEKICDYYKNLYTDLSGSSSYSTWKYTLNYFRCYTYENGNNENSEGLATGANTDVICTGRMRKLSYWLLGKKHQTGKICIPYSGFVCYFQEWIILKGAIANCGTSSNSTW